MSNHFFVVVAHDPDAYRSVPDDQEAAFFWNLGDALNHRDSLNEEPQPVPYEVFVCAPRAGSASSRWSEVGS